MPRVLITETATYVAGKIILDLDYQSQIPGAAPELDIEDILHDMIWHLLRYKRPENIALLDFLNSFSVIPVVQIMTTGRTAADVSTAVGRRVKTLANIDEALIERIQFVNLGIIENMEQSGNTEFTNADIQIFFLFANRDTGGKAITPCAYMDKLTAVTHKDDAGNPISCAAFALACATTTHQHKTRHLNLIKLQAIEIQRLCEYSQFVHISGFQTFVDLNHDYRVTVVTSPLHDQSRFTYTGKNYKLEFQSDTSRKLTPDCQTHTLYILLDATKKHYGLFNRNAYAALANAAGSAGTNYFMCHQCMKISNGRLYNICLCRNPDARKPKKQRVHQNCEYCGGAACSKGLCFRQCKNCVAKIRNEYSHDNHRCIVHDESTPAVFRETGENTGKEKEYKLWAYDLESCRVFTDMAGNNYGFQSVFVRHDHTFAPDHEVIFERKSLQKPNLLVVRNVFNMGEQYIFREESCIQDFLVFMVNHNSGYNIFVAHNGSGYDTQLIADAASLMNFKKSVITCGLKFTQLQIEKMLFRDSMLHLQGSLASLAQNFSLTVGKGYFPHLFNTRENKTYVGEVPDEKFFDLTFSARKQSDIVAFKEWYNDRKNFPWDFNVELEKYCIMDVDILSKVMKSFHDVCIAKFNASPWFHPTAPSYCHRTILRANTKKMNLPQDPEERASTINQISKENWSKLEPQEYWFARRALIGGRTDVKRVHYRLSEEDIAAGKSIVYQDIVSMYPFVQVHRDCHYPVGAPKILILDEKWYPCLNHQSGDKSNNWNRCNCPRGDRIASGLVNAIERYTWQPTSAELIGMHNEFFGIWCVSLIPPKNLFHPVLCIYDAKNKKRVATLEDIHEEIFTSIEIVKALQVGYKLVKVHRMDVYNHKQGIWRDFVKDLYIEKMANSESLPSEEEQTRLINAYEDRFGMGQDVINSFTTGDGWGFRAALRMTYKIMLNSGWGKHCTRPNLPCYSFLNPEEEESMAELVMGLASGELDITNMGMNGNDFCVRTIAANSKHIPHDLYLPAGLFVPAHGRLLLYSALEKLGDRVLYHDTDSVIYIHDPAKENLLVNDIWGSWDEEKVSKNGNITAFVGLGAKSYAIKTRNGEDVIKLKGISLKRAHERQVHFNSLEQLLFDKKSLLIPQMNMPYKLGVGKTVEETLKKVNFDPMAMKGYLHTDMRVYPPGYCLGCLSIGEHTC